MAIKEEYYIDGEDDFLSKKVKRYKCEDCNQYWEISYGPGRKEDITKSDIILDDGLLQDEDTELISCPMCGSPYIIEI